MTATTTNKKEIVDFLWEWAESNGEWSKILIDKVVSTENELLQSDRIEIFKYFLQSFGQYSGLQPQTFTKPSYSPTDKVVELESISKIVRS